MRAELKGVLAASKTTAIYVTHDQVEAMSLADRISVMQGGHIVQAASPTEIYRNPASQFVAGFIGNPPMNFLPARQISKGKWQVAGTSYGASTAERAVFAVRPEDVAPAASGLVADVKIIEPLEVHLLVTCDVDGYMFRAIMDTDSTITSGEKIAFAPIKDRIRWFDLKASTVSRSKESMMGQQILQSATDILKKNDLGRYTVPTHGLYPFQWNWDSCLTALGLAYIDESRAWTEIETLFDHQWDDGMVPYIIFHKQDDGYFRGTDVWSTGHEVPTSGITQPAVAGFAVNRLFERAQTGRWPNSALARYCQKLLRGMTGSIKTAILRQQGWGDYPPIIWQR